MKTIDKLYFYDIARVAVNAIYRFEMLSGDFLTSIILMVLNRSD